MMPCNLVNCDSMQHHVPSVTRFSLFFFWGEKQKAARLHFRILAAQWECHTPLAVDLLWKSSMGVVR